MSEDEPLVAVFVPTLLSCLMRAEHEKGSPLTRDEVFAIRDQASSILLPEQLAQSAEEKRGYTDLESTSIWEGWQAYREQEAENRRNS
jgi:hypothetical protein